MRLSTLLLVLLGHLALTGAWDINFKRSLCFQNGLDDLGERMPLSLHNLVSLVEKFEERSTYMNPDAVAEALIHRYCINGITFASISNANPWSPNDINEVHKQEMVWSLITMDQIVPDSTYEPREECSLHFMLSHGVDLYPHGGLDYVWENSAYRRRREVQAGTRYSLPSNMQPATHPMENGVIWTSSGPVAAGTLLAGIMVRDTSLGLTIDSMYNSQGLDFMPDEMLQKRVMPLHAATLAGDIGQSAMIGYLAAVASASSYLGPSGMFANSTAAPKVFTLEQNYGLTIPYLTRAEVFAGIDSLLIQKVLRESSSNQLSLSDALRMYYSEHGLPGYPDYKACNRLEAFKSLDQTVIKEQALHFMYAYSAKIASIKELISQNKDQFLDIENAFQRALTNSWTQFINFVDSYDYSEFDRCADYSNKVMCENKVDLLVVYSREGGETEIKKERDYMAHLGQLLDVGVDRSRIGVLDGKTANVMFPMTNFSNVADWGSNFSTSTDNIYGSSGSDMMKVMGAITAYYTNFYNNLRSDANNATANSQVVLWNAPSSVLQQEEFLQLMDSFKVLHPDVYFLFVGKNKGALTDLMVDPNQDFFQITGQDMFAFAKTIAERICQIPSVFVYPACNPDNRNFTSYAESSHTYTGYVSPNYTTYIKIAPNYFQYSEKVMLQLKEGDVTVCSSRVSMNVETNAEDRMCHDTNSLEWWHLCGRYLDQCAPIYLAVTGSSSRTNSYCQDKQCQYPNQIKFQIQHEGMTCGAWAAPPSILLLAVGALVLLLRSQP